MKKIQDYGEKIGGAKKDLFSDYAEKISENLNERDANLWDRPLSALFPKPDYEGLSSLGVSHEILSALCTLRGDIPRKPAGAKALTKMPSWIRAVRSARSDANAIIRSRDPREAQRIMNGKDDVARLTYETMKTMPSSALGKAEGHHVLSHAGRLYVINAAKKILFEADVRAAPLPELIKRAGTALTKNVNVSKDPKKRTAEARIAAVMKKIMLYKNGAGTWDMELRTSSGRVLFGEGFKSLKDGQDWFLKNKAILQAKVAACMVSPDERKNVLRPRSGPSRRTGDVSVEQLSQAFGLRAVEFGNYVEGKRRQRELNDMWDALTDLSEILGVDTKALGLGVLGISFGARGGGRNMAHYEPTHRVINLTKSQGAGCIAHEWFHSADNAASMKDPKDKTERSSRMASEMTQAGQDLQKSWSGYEERMQALDATRSKRYWSRPDEMAARCFETWLVNKLAANGIENDHLVEIDARSIAYPTPEEMLRIAPEMERFTRFILSVEHKGFTPEDDDLLRELFDDPDFV